jgi:hypothetical protein
MRIAKPTIVDVLGKLEAMGFYRKGGSPFTVPKIKGRRVRASSEDAAVSSALDLFVGTLTPRDVGASPLFGDSTPDDPFAELNLTAFLDHISGEGFRPETIGVVTKNKEWDAAGWYCPVHFYGFDWGIYIRPRGVFEIALDILAKYSEPMTMTILKQAREHNSYLERDETISSEKREEHRHPAGISSVLSGRYYQEWLDRGYTSVVTWCVKWAYFVLFHHELFHYLVESFGTRSEFLTGNPIYVSYSDSVYKRAKGTKDLIEEALANAFAYRAVEQTSFGQSVSRRWPFADDLQKIVIAYLQDRFPNDPPGYNRALEFVSDDGFDRGIDVLLAQIKQANAKPLGNAQDACVLRAGFESLFAEENVRCVEVPEARGQRILPDASLPFDNRGKPLQKLMRKEGFTLAREGEHEVWVKLGFPPIAVPRTKNFGNGTAESILKKINPTYRLRDFEQIARGRAA